jgi:hypothetical protein
MKRQKVYFLCVDYQYDFVSPEGKAGVIGNSPLFIADTLIPFLVAKDFKVSEIISDYRLPRGKSHSESCVPGTQGFQSLLPDHVRYADPHIKCMHSPLWTRNNIGIADQPLGKEYQAPELFNDWVSRHFPDKTIPIVMFGETMECCLLNVAQELYFRGHNVYILYEATDPMPERQSFKDDISHHSTLSLYAKSITFKELLVVLMCG